VQLRQTRTQKKIVVDESLSLSKRLLREEPDVAELDAPPKRINALPDWSVMAIKSEQMW